MTLRTILVVAPLLTVLLAAAAAEERPQLKNPFFAMDTGLGHGGHNTAEQQAQTLAELGYAGSDHTGTRGLPETLKAYQARGLRLFGIYVGLNIDSPDVPAGIAAAVGQLKGSGAFLWVPLQSRKFSKSDPAGDEQAVALLGKLADLAEPAGLTIAIYPHTGFWVERVEDAARVARKTGRKSVGATFNLCHWLQVDGHDLEGSLRAAGPQLAAVTINGADSGAKGWDRLIQTLDKGTFDAARVLYALGDRGYNGPIGLQAWGIKGDWKENLRRSMEAWRRLSARAASKRERFLAGEGLGAFADNTGDWLIVGDVFTDPADEKKLTWKPGTGVLVNGPKGRTRNLFTKFQHGDCEAHVEFMVPKGSNSGVYFQGRYEVQVYDSFGVAKDAYPGIECGGIYPRWVKGEGVNGHSPRVNVSRKMGEWQTFDVIFRAPRFDAAGKKTADARFVRVEHNGVIVHEDVVLTGPTRAAAFGDEKPLGPLMLQGDHGPVAYRNLWLIPRDLSEEAK